MDTKELIKNLNEKFGMFLKEEDEILEPETALENEIEEPVEEIIEEPEEEKEEQKIEIEVKDDKIEVEAELDGKEFEGEIPAEDTEEPEEIDFKDEVEEPAEEVEEVEESLISKLNKKFGMALSEEVEVVDAGEETAENARKALDGIDYVLGTYGFLGEEIGPVEEEQIRILEEAKEVLRSMVPELQ